MTDTILDRTLWYQEGGERRLASQQFLLSDARSLVVLGEAGMGKSTLLRELGASGDGYVLCTARALINAPDADQRFGGARTLIIDALDEVPAQNDGDAVDLVVRKLGELGYPRFILSCRVADWRSATALQGLSDLYGAPPLELYLEPLERSDAVSFLGATLGEARAEEAAGTLEAQGLAGLWSNPQTLALIRQVVAEGTLPSSRGQLFQQATRLLRREHRSEKRSAKLASLPESAVLDAAGAAFATLILTGAEAFTLHPSPESGDLDLSEIATLPGGTVIRDILDARLFAALGDDRFTYAHRAIGEFLGARWLAGLANTGRIRRRVHSLFNADALVPASLRGLHAWLAWHGPELANAVIVADPMGVVQYGDADALPITQARGLLRALEDRSRADPRFRDWTRYRVAGLAQRPLLPRLVEVIEAEEAEFGLRLLLLQALEGSPLVAEIASVLETLAGKSGVAYALRSEAVDRLHETGGGLDWPRFVRTVLQQGDEDGVRLAIETIDVVGYDRFDDQLVLDAAVAQLERSERTVGVLYGLEHRLPLNRIDDLLDGLAAVAAAQGDPHERPRAPALTDLVYGLMARRLTARPVTSDKLWSWLEPFDGHHGYQTTARDLLASTLRGDDTLRQAIQRTVLLQREGADNVWSRSWRMSERSPGLTPNEADVVALLATLPSSDRRWRDLVILVQHNGEQGQAVRTAAARFAADDPESATWLEALSSPETPQWQIDQDARRNERRAERERRWAKHRADFTRKIDAMRAGHYGFVVDPAKAYLNLFVDMGDKASDGPERIAEWLGEDLQQAALVGFEAFLTTAPVRPDAAEIARSFAESKRWDATYVIVAALAERHRTGRGFSDLPTERVMAGFFELRHSRIDDHAGVPDLDQILTDELRGRGAWEEAQRLYFEPQFEFAREHVDGLYGLLREPADRALADRLAAEWLTRFEGMAVGPEAELIDHLLASSTGAAVLRSLVTSRRQSATGDTERRLNWDSAGLLVDFEETRHSLEAAGEPKLDLLWHVRSRLGTRRAEGERLALDADQLTWMLRTFRSRFPAIHRPSGVTTGDTNTWDASDFISALIRRLGDDVSDQAIAAIAGLRDADPDGYTEQFRIVAAEQRRKRIEADWSPPAFETVSAAVRDAPPTTATQLQAVIIEELGKVQRELRGSDVDWRLDFITGETPHVEERCRDALIKMMRPLPFGIEALPEGHLADDKRCDIMCLLGRVMTPIEIKGQWHPELWTSADQQLDRLYVNDSRAEVGIYLVLWFGSASTKPLRRPPARADVPASAAELQAALTERSATTRASRVKVVVLDFERPA